MTRPVAQLPGMAVDSVSLLHRNAGRYRTCPLVANSLLTFQHWRDGKYGMAAGERNPMIGRDWSTTIWYRALMLVLVCVLIAPQALLPALSQADDHHVAAPFEEPQGADHHHSNTTEGDVTATCHIGFDCHFQAIVEIHGMPFPPADLDGQEFLPRGQIEPGIEHGFDPPPPRVMS